MPSSPAGQVTGFNVAAVYCVDLDRARDFYVNTLGLTFESNMDPGMLLKAGDVTVYLEGGGLGGGRRVEAGSVRRLEPLQIIHDLAISARSTP